MQVDTITKPPFIRRPRDEDFIKEQGLDFKNSQDSAKYIVYLVEKYTQDTAIQSNTATFQKNCLETCLESRSVEYTPNDTDNVKLILALSGACKTRLLLELLFTTPGYYFVAKSSLYDFGSNDLYQCHVYCDAHPGEAQKAIQLLYFIRVTVCNYLKTIGFGTPEKLLLAQIHPHAFFGNDVFQKLFDTLIKDPAIEGIDITDHFSFAAIDEIQMTLKGRSYHRLPGSINNRAFFSPLVHYSKSLKKFTQFLICGTGIDFVSLKDSLESGTMKRQRFMAYEVVSPFQPFTRSHAVEYSTRILKVLGSEDGYQHVVDRIAQFDLCHGRPRFIAFIIDGYLASGDIETAIAEFNAALSNVDGLHFPLRFYKADLDSGKRSLDRVIAGDTLGSILCNGLLDFILKGEFRFRLSENDDAVKAIEYGIGYGRVAEGNLVQIVVKEKAILECLRHFVPFTDVVMTLTKRIGECVNPQTVGYLLEYLVVFAIVSNYSVQGTTNKLIAYQRFPYLYLEECAANQICFPDHMCGPDVLYKCSNTKTVYIIQVKFVKAISKQEAANACNTTDPNYFYRRRKSPHNIIRGYEDKRAQLLTNLRMLQIEEGYSLQQMLFVHSGGKKDVFTREALLVTQSTTPDIFNSLGSRIWEFLDHLRDRF